MESNVVTTISPGSSGLVVLNKCLLGEGLIVLPWWAEVVGDGMIYLRALLLCGHITRFFVGQKILTIGAPGRHSG